MTFSFQLKSLLVAVVFSSNLIWGAKLIGPITLENFQEPQTVENNTNPVIHGTYKVWSEANGKVSVTDLNGNPLWNWQESSGAETEIDELVFPNATTLTVLLSGSDMVSGAYFFELSTGKLIRTIPYIGHETAVVNADTFYLTDSNVLLAYNRHTLALLWQTRLPERKAKPYNLTFVGKHLITGYAWYIYLINAETGAIEDEAHTRCFINGGDIFLTSPDKFVTKQGCSGGEASPSWTKYTEYKIRWN